MILQEPEDNLLSLYIHHQEDWAAQKNQGIVYHTLKSYSVQSCGLRNKRTIITFIIYNRLPIPLTAVIK